MFYTITVMTIIITQSYFMFACAFSYCCVFGKTVRGKVMVGRSILCSSAERKKKENNFAACPQAAQSEHVLLLSASGIRLTSIHNGRKRFKTAGEVHSGGTVKLCGETGDVRRLGGGAGRQEKTLRPVGRHLAALRCQTWTCGHCGVFNKACGCGCGGVQQRLQEAVTRSCVHGSPRLR